MGRARRTGAGAEVLTSHVVPGTVWGMGSGDPGPLFDLSMPVVVAAPTWDVRRSIPNMAMYRPLSLSSLSVPFLLLGLGNAQDTPPLVRKGRCFEVHCYGGDEVLADRALAAVEPVWAAVAKTLGRPEARPRRLLTVHLYRTLSGYEAADRRLTNGKFARNLAMTHYASESAHVALQPPCSDETLRAIGLPGLTLEMLAWEATHLVRRELLGTHAEHPMWLVDGLAADTARTVARNLLAPAADAWPTTDTAVGRVRRLADGKQLPSASTMLADRIEELDMQDRYAARAVFFAFLRAEHAAALGKVLAAVRSTGGGKDYLERVLAVASTNFGKKLDGAFTKHVAGLGNAWFEVYRSLMPFEGGWQQIAFPDTNAIAWHQRPVDGGALRIDGSLRILPGEGRQMNVLFGRTDAGDFYSVAFVADVGFTVFSFRAKDSEWRNLGSGSAPSLRRGYTSTFVIVARGDALRVQLDGQHWDFELPQKLPNAVPWGLGAQAGGEGAAMGTAGLWTGVRAGVP